MQLTSFTGFALAACVAGTSVACGGQGREQDQMVAPRDTWPAAPSSAAAQARRPVAAPPSFAAAAANPPLATPVAVGYIETSQRVRAAFQAPQGGNHPPRSAHRRLPSIHS